LAISYNQIKLKRGACCGKGDRPEGAGSHSGKSFARDFLQNFLKPQPLKADWKERSFLEGESIGQETMEASIEAGAVFVSKAENSPA
jgi:hypothetical protein